MATAPLPMPALLRWGYRLALLCGGLLFVTALSTSFGCSDVSELKSMPFGEWNVPVWVGHAFISSGFMIAIGYSLRNRQPGARKLIVAFWFTGLVLLIGDFFLARQQSGGQVAGVWVATAFLNSLLAIAFGAWYLFGKQNVRQYFERLRAPEA